MKPGDKIIEQELASEFGISRGPVREALRQLEQEGMVEYSRNVGCSVKHIGMDDVYEIYYMRANYEMMAVRLYNCLLYTSVWMFIQPVVTIVIYAVIFGIGFKSPPPVPGVSYVIWLVPGIVPWFFFGEALNGITGCLQEYSYLVKKVVFKVEILPMIKLISCLLVQMCIRDRRSCDHGLCKAAS